MILVIVESPAKSKTIAKYLGGGFIVKSSVGHITGMPKKELGIDINNNYQPTYLIEPGKKSVVAELRKYVKEASEVILATDDDREGEAIAWHLTQVLKLPIPSTKRMKFNEITAKALKVALTNSQSLRIDMDMVNSQQARRVIDRLVGFKVSPLLWAKIIGAKSAGRVQSPICRLLVEKELEIKKFTSSYTYAISATAQDSEIKIKAVYEQKLVNETEVMSLLERLSDVQTMSVIDKTCSKVKVSPPPPFITSTLQQVASSKLGIKPKQTMQLAQSLYQNGLITYMRTDSITLSDDALIGITAEIIKQYGQDYYQGRQFKSKSDNAQEAHEAIRPSDITKVKASDNDNEQRVYELIRNRVLASQMSDAVKDKTIIYFNIGSVSKFIAVGEVIVFDGFMKLINNKSDADILPNLNVNDSVMIETIIAKQNHTKLPGRYTEASLITKIEKMGIGRPSTFANMVDVVQQRGYAKVGSINGQDITYDVITLEQGKISKSKKSQKYGADKNKLFPTRSALDLVKFLNEYFANIMDYKFTAKLEKDLDKIASGQVVWHRMVDDFYQPLNAKIQQVSNELADVALNDKSLGQCPKTGANITVGKGKYGHFVKLNTEPAKFSNIPKHINPDNIDLNTALLLLTLPRDVGFFNNKPIIASYGKNGGYLKCDNIFINLDDGMPETISSEKAQQLYQNRANELANNPSCEDPKCGKPLVVKDGKFGKWYACTGFPKCKHKQSKKPS